MDMGAKTFTAWPVWRHHVYRLDGRPLVLRVVDDHGERQHAALAAGHVAGERGHGVEAAGLHAEQAVVRAGDDTVPRRADQAGDGQSLRRRGGDAGGEIALLYLDQRGHADLDPGVRPEQSAICRPDVSMPCSASVSATACVSVLMLLPA